MSTLAYFRERPDYGLGRAFALAFAVHAVLLAVLFLGVRWQNHEAEVVAVELWDPPPPPPPVVEAPKPPPPVVEPPKPKPAPEPEVKKPDIVEKAPPPKPKPEPKKKLEAKPKPEPKPKDDKFQQDLARAQLEAEQRRFDEQKRLAEEQKRLAEEARRKAEAERIARELASAARSKALDDYINRIRVKVRGNWVLPQDLSGNPVAEFDVVQLPTGEILSVKLSRSSGNPAYDTAVERAILKSSPLPLPEPRSLFDRRLKLRLPVRD